MIGNHKGKAIYRIDYQYTETVADGSVDKEDTAFFLAEAPEQAIDALRAMKEPVDVRIGIVTAVFDGEQLNYTIPPQTYA